MSVVAARVYEDKVVVAADSITVRGYSKRTDDHAKITYLNEMIIGGCGKAQDTCVLQRYMQTHKPEDATERDVLAFFLEFAKWKKDFTGDSEMENAYLMVYKGHLYAVEGLFVHEVENFMAIGAGDDFANAALYLGHTPSEAVKVACELCCWVAEPIIEYEMPIPTGSK